MLKVAVEQGAEVAEGDLICVIEAMKMENEIVAHRSGKVTALNVAEGAAVSAATPSPSSSSRQSTVSRYLFWCPASARSRSRFSRSRWRSRSRISRRFWAWRREASLRVSGNGPLGSEQDLPEHSVSRSISRWRKLRIGKKLGTLR